MNSVRLFPVVALAALCMLALKFCAFLIGDSGTLTGSGSAVAQSQPQAGADQAGTAEKGEAAPKAESAGQQTESNSAQKPAEQMPKRDVVGPGSVANNSEFKVLQNLVQRRKVLETREKELFLRENLLKAAEKRIEERISKLKVVEGRIHQTIKKQEALESERFTRLVQMYSAMKPADAARLFNRLDMEILTGLVQRMKARTMAPIIAKMDSEQAQRLTIELAKKQSSKAPEPSDLPKIGG